MSNIKDIISEIESGKITTKEQLSKRKRQLSKGQKLPKNADILCFSKNNKAVRAFLKTKPTRTASGIAVVAVMTPPHKCPHGKCTYCPHVDNVPESYTGKEPAARRAFQNNYNPYKQVQNRIMQLTATGHNPQKIELIIMGGTFPACPEEEQVEFIKGCFAGMNDFPKAKEWKNRSLEKEQKKNETSKYRCIGLTLETRPDYCKEKHIALMLKLGATRVELGVQTVYDNIYKKINRGHSVQDVIEATRLLKDAGFKVLYHMMPGLPNSTFKKDVDMFKEIFANNSFKPDMLKIYPTLVIDNTELYEMWKAKKYRPIDEEYFLKLLKEIKNICPPYVRIMRIERDIPGTEIIAGIKSTNIRQIAQQRGIECRCIRCREVGQAVLHSKKLYAPKLNKTVYCASDGTEYFLEYADKNNTLFGFLRMRLNSTPIAYIRELHIYGEQTPLNAKGTVQHRGLGKKLLKEAEKIAKQNKKETVYVISGVGVREYYKKQGYKKEKSYMAKRIIPARSKN